MLTEFDRNKGYDRQLGLALLTFGSFSLIYYSIWVLVIPLVNDKHIIRAFFPRQSIVLALGIPITIMTAFFVFVGIYAFITMKNTDKTQIKQLKCN